MNPTTDETRPPVEAGDSERIPSDPTISEAMSSVSADAFRSDSSGLNKSREPPGSVANDASHQSAVSADNEKAHLSTESYNYVVWAWESMNEVAMDRIYEKILSIVKDSSTIYISDTIQVGVNYWRADFTDDEVRIMESMPEVPKQRNYERLTVNMLTLDRSLLWIAMICMGEILAIDTWVWELRSELIAWTTCFQSCR